MMSKMMNIEWHNNVWTKHDKEYMMMKVQTFETAIKMMIRMRKMNDAINGWAWKKVRTPENDTNTFPTCWYCQKYRNKIQIKQQWSTPIARRPLQQKQVILQIRRLHASTPEQLNSVLLTKKRLFTRWKSKYIEKSLVSCVE